MGEEQPLTVEMVGVLNSRIDAVEGDIRQILESGEAVRTNVAVLRERSDKAGDNCPKRVEIARAFNGSVHAKERAELAYTLAQKAVDLTIENRVDVAKLAAVAAGGGGVGGLIAGIVIAVIQYMSSLP